MSGHSKWSTIKHKKAALDAKRGKVFTKIIKEISVAARSGGGDPMGNPRLRFLLEKARAVNMPQDNAQRAIKKGTGELPGQHYEAHTYEGYGPGGIAVVVDVLSDNKNRAVGELRHVFSRHHGNLGESGSVSWMFDYVGVLQITGENLSEDFLLERLIEFPIKDIEQEGDTCMIICEPRSLEAVKQVVVDLGLHVKEADLEWIPKNYVPLNADQTAKATDFLNALEELEDVQNVYSNIE